MSVVSDVIVSTETPQRPLRIRRDEQVAMHDAHHAAGRVASLDGLRALAVLAVVLHHGGAMSVGWLGVDLFFVLSGFLITTLLVREHQQAGAISLPRFWGRRVLRLMPAYWLYIGSVTVLLLASSQPLVAHAGFRPGTFIASMWCYFQNYLPMGGFSEYQALTRHLWSLCVEEQFYFIWPVVCVFAMRLRRPEIVGWMLLAAILLRRSLELSQSAPPAAP